MSCNVSASSAHHFKKSYCIFILYNAKSILCLTEADNLIMLTAFNFCGFFSLCTFSFICVLSSSNNKERTLNSVYLKKRRSHKLLVRYIRNMYLLYRRRSYLNKIIKRCWHCNENWSRGDFCVYKQSNN